MRFALPVTAFFLLLTSGCGYIGPVVPPSPMIPARIVDLSAVERGNNIIIHFTTPPRTTDALAIDKFSSIDLRVGVVPGEHVDQEGWEASAQPVEVDQLYAGGDKDEPRSLEITKNVPAQPWEGKTVLVQVRSAVKSRDHFSEWSNPVLLAVVPPLRPPDIHVQSTGAGYKVTWQEDKPGEHFQVLRQGPGEKSPNVVGIAEKPEYIDGTAQWDTSYDYSVVAQLGKAESLPSSPVHVNSPDKFPPAVPSNLVALAGPDSVELTWARNTEPDLKGYFVYRSTNGGPFERQGDMVSVPSFSDRHVEHGKTYRYALSAVDTKNNVSDNSPPVEVAY